MPPLIWRALFGIASAIALYGWGALLDDLLQEAGPGRVPVARGALGLAAVLALGGLLNVFHLLIAPVYWLLFGAGAVCAVAAGIRKWRAGTIDWKWWAIVMIVGFLVLPVYLQSVDTDRLNPNDDFYSYLVMPMRILQLGTLQPDVFNYRAAISGPGGMAFLQAPVIGLFGVNAVRLADQGTGLVLLVGTSATFFRRFAVPVPAAAALLAGAVLLAEHALVNITSYFTTMALLVGLFQVLCAGEDGQLASPVFAALMLAGIAALKNTALPFAGMLCVLFVLSAWRARQPRLFRNTAVAFLTTGAVVLAWYLPRLLTRVDLLALKHGDGPDQVSLAYMLWWIVSGGGWNWAYFVVFAVLWGAALRVTRGRAENGPVLLLGLAIIGGAAALNYASGGVAITRYTQPLFLVAYLACATLLLAAIPRRGWQAGATLALVGGFLAFRLPPPTGSGLPEGGFNRVAGYFALDGGQPAGRYLNDYPAAVRHAWQGPPLVYPTALQSAAAQRMQNAMLPGETALIYTDLPFLLDFARNRLSVMDLPAAGPPPGLPGDSADGENLVKYLRANSIRYLAYAYGNEAGFPAAPAEARLPQPRFTPWQRALIRRIPSFHKQLLVIAAHRPKVYDDGKTVVVDLAVPPTAPAQSGDRDPSRP